MRRLPWILVVFLLVACVVVWFRPHEPLPAEIRTETKIKTIVKVDTLLISPPMAPLLTIRLIDTMRIGDTIVNREQAYYEDSLYRAWVSGYKPKLDSLQVFPRTVYQTVTNDIYQTIKVKDKHRWGLGVSVGYGACRFGLSPYIGVGVYYKIW